MKDESHVQLLKSTNSLYHMKDEFLAFVDELEGDYVHLINLDLLRDDFRQYMQMLENHSKGIGLPDNWVPHTTYWYINDEKHVIGSGNIRHYLTPSLKEYGGHISYLIRSGYRRKGHATKLLQLLEEE